MASLIYNVFIFAIQSQGPPPPAGGTGGKGPNLPIDENIWILLAIGIIFGIYIIYRRNRSITNKVS